MGKETRDPVKSAHISRWSDPPIGPIVNIDEGTATWPEDWGMKKKRNWVEFQRKIHRSAWPGEPEDPNGNIAVLERSLEKNTAAPLVGRTFTLDPYCQQSEFLRYALFGPWGGQLLLASRAQLGEVVTRKEANRPGVYFLRSENGNRSKIYVGNTMEPPHSIRIYNDQNWWEQIVVLSTTDVCSLDSKDVIYLQSKLIKRAKDADRTDLCNSQILSPPQLSKFHQLRMEHFFDQTLMILPMLGIDDFTGDTERSLAGDAQIFHMTLPGDLGEACAVYLTAKKFVVLAGSSARREWVGKSSGNDGPKERHAQLLRDGILVLDGDRCRFAQDYEFAAVSTAAKVVAGAPRSGTRNWRIPGQTTTLQEWLRAQKMHSPRDNS